MAPDDWLADPKAWVLAVERAYVDAAVGKHLPPASGHHAVAAAAAGAVASRYLAVSVPRSFGLIGDDASARLSLAAHSVWFAPIDVRSVGNALGRAVSIDEALASDIVCIHVPLAITASQLRRGTHVNALAPIELDTALTTLATIIRETPGLGQLAAGIVDGRTFDEITIFLLGDAATARAALTPSGRTAS